MLHERAATEVLSLNDLSDSLSGECSQIFCQSRMQRALEDGQPGLQQARV
jgi:hypothetical protein